MVYDCFMFFNEIDLLEIRLNVLDDTVDKFVITEGNTTLMGEKRELLFPKYKERFAKFQDKIIYNICDNTNRSFPNQWEREQYQKNYVINGVKDASEDDIVIYSDIDEIPNPIGLKEAIEHFDCDKIYHFAQRMFNFYLNYENVDKYLLAYCNDYDDVPAKRWMGTKMCSVKMARKFGMDALRAPERLREPGERIADGGWHFSYMGGDGDSVTKRVKNKLQSFSHCEFNKFRYYNIFHIMKTVRDGKDFLGRDAVFARVNIDGSYPEYIRNNQEKYRHLILK